MSSLMQFRGVSNARGVGIQSYLTQVESTSDPEWRDMNLGKPSEPEVACTKCGKAHPQLYTFFRKPKGMFGNWVVFRYNGEDRVPDLSGPLYLKKMPRDAEKMTVAENCEAWHKE